MCAAGDISDLDARRAALVDELMAEMTVLRAQANAIAHEIHRQVMEDPTTATAEASLRFQRMVTAITRIGGFQLLLLEKAGTLEREANEARERRAAAALRARRKLGADRTMQAAYLFDKAAIQPAEADCDFDAEDIRRDLFNWLFDNDYPERFADMSVGDMMIDITRAAGLAPDTSSQTLEQWKAAVRERWAPLDGVLQGFDPRSPTFPLFAAGP